ncbi:CD99 antigen isoform X2 [Anolis carolinensis]|uniref:CD99 antigen isoform X2 n=1 Tax=Anolis carolinensis TaxID=28377 RepID=UPI0007DB853F|nr:PREDICTED: CD99 antigen isoform X2 [Anolis carolinensis]|eukprot:XP_016847847.1 PREDICTED: CD99 antigen isoform X2 [Anolis carolinensis]
MERLALFVSAALLLLASQSRGQDFDLEDALSDIEPTKKPTLPTKHTPLLDDLDLGDAVIGEDPHKPDPPRPQPNPGTHEDTGGLSDADLADGGVLPADPPAGPGGRASNPSKGGHGSGSNENAEGSQGMLAGIISSVVVAIAGAVSSFIAYQKKKLCFKQSDQENVNMESQQGAHAEPPVQRTLLQKS